MSEDLYRSAVQSITEHRCTLAELIGFAERFKADKKPDVASQLYGLWIQHNQQDPVLYAAHFNYAILLSDVGKLTEAKESLETAIKLNPDFYPAYINIGNVLERMMMPAEAIGQWTALVNKLHAVSANALNYKLSALKQMGRLLEIKQISANAENALKMSLELNPNQNDVIQHYIALRLKQCEWPIISLWEGMDRKTLMKGIGPLSMGIYSTDPIMQLASGWSYCRSHIGYPKIDLQSNHDIKKFAARKGRRRIGYVSSDLRNHAVGFIMAELFEQHDREQFEIFVYYCGIKTDDPIQQRVKNSVDHWLDINDMNDTDAAQRIIDDGIEILVDVNGYTKDARTKVFAMRPAPVIVNWLGYPGSMASPYHHYIIADDAIIPKEHEIYYTEKVLRLPCYQPNDRKRAPSEKRPTREDVGLPENAFVFCSFNGAQKLSRFTFDRWITILKEVPDSVLWLLDGGGSTNKNITDYAIRQGIAAERIIFAGKKPNADHLARYPLADLFLDSLPYGAHVTASDSLWMGVPVLTICGNTFPSRVCSSLLAAAGIPEMKCRDADEYVRRAIGLANDREKIECLKKQLLENRDKCILFDIASTTHHLEQLYTGMWDDYLNGDLPRPDLTNLDTYLDIGSEQDFDKNEILDIEAIHAHYMPELIRRHKYCPLLPDSRLWTAENIAETESTSRVIPLKAKKQPAKQDAEPKAKKKFRLVSKK